MPYSKRMKQIEIRLDVEIAKPLLRHVEPLLEELEDKLASPSSPPEEDEDIADFWTNDLLEAQRKDVAAIVDLFDQEFFENGRVVVELENSEFLLRGCAALRLRLRETSLKDFSDHVLETGDIAIGALDEYQKIGYRAYAFFASLQEILITQLDAGLGAAAEEEGEFDEDDEGDEVDYEGAVDDLLDSLSDEDLEDLDEDERE